MPTPNPFPSSTITLGGRQPPSCPERSRAPNREAGRTVSLLSRSLCRNGSSKESFDPHQAIDETREFRERDTKISPIVREIIVELFPEISENTPFGRFSLRLFNHALSHGRVDENTGGKIIPCSLIARFAGTEWDSNFLATAWLDQFEKVFNGRLKITITSWQFTKGRARTLIVEWPLQIQTALAEQEFYMMSDLAIDKQHQKTRVYFMTGKTVSRRDKIQEKKIIIAERQNACNILPPEAMQKPLLDLLNRHLTERSQAIHNAMMPGVVPLVVWWKQYRESPFRTHHHGKPRDTAPQRRYREWLGSMIVSLSEPFQEGYYRPSDKTVRLHSIGLVANYLPRQGRAALFDHLTQLDLKNSQFAIAARLWEVQSALEILAEGKSIWDHVLRELGLQPDTKPALKKCLYSLLFGMRRRSLQSELNWNLQDAGLNPSKSLRVAKQFLELDVMQDMLNARETQLQRIYDNGGVQLSDWEWQGVKHPGKWLDLEDVPGHYLEPAGLDLDEIPDQSLEWDMLRSGRRGEQVLERNKRSLLAQQMQAAEMGIMLAATGVIAKTPDITIVSFLHDGLTLTFSDSSKREQQLKSIQKAVAKHCVEKGFLTCLEGN